MCFIVFFNIPSKTWIGLLSVSCFATLQIERIQNPYYWQAYQIKKLEMDAKNGTTNNEKRLFHGTARSSLTLINNSGFNRSYAGFHGKMVVRPLLWVVWSCVSCAWLASLVERTVTSSRIVFNTRQRSLMIVAWNTCYSGALKSSHIISCVALA